MVPMVDRYLLRYFLAVIDYGNFSKAAAQCHVSQPTLSVGIAKLEQGLGRPLFRRTNRRVELTEAAFASLFTRGGSRASSTPRNRISGRRGRQRRSGLAF